MPNKYVYRLTKPVTIVLVTILWVLCVLPILILIINGGINIFAVIIFSPLIILLAPFALRGLYDRVIIMEELILLKMVLL